MQEFYGLFQILSLKILTTIKADPNEDLDSKYFSNDEIMHFKLKYNDINIFNQKEQKTKHQKIRYFLILIQIYVPRFTMGEILGKGAFGTVYLGFNKDNGKLMAIKKISICKSLTQSQIDSIEYEVELLKELSHENVVKFFGSQKSSKSITLLFEYISGKP